QPGVSRTGEGNLEVRALKEGARNAEPERAIEAVARTARKHARPGDDRFRSGIAGHHHAVTVDGNRPHPRPRPDLRTGGAALFGERRIEDGAIDDSGANAIGVDEYR